MKKNENFINISVYLSKDEFDYIIWCCEKYNIIFPQNYISQIIRAFILFDEDYRKEMIK